MSVFDPLEELLYDCIRHLIEFCDKFPDAAYPTEKKPDAFFAKDLVERVDAVRGKAWGIW